MDFINDMAAAVGSTYGWEGVALGISILAAFVVQMVYHAGIYAWTARFRLSARRQILDSEPPVSVVVPMFGENSAYLDEGLQILLSQDYHTYEVVLVYVGNDDNFLADLKFLQSSYPNLRIVNIEHTRYAISAKMVLNLGIKAARYEHIITTTADAEPVSDRWLALMGKAFTYDDVILGYCGLESRPTLASFFSRAQRLSESVEWITTAIRHMPSGASKHNLGFTKTLYFGVRGFGHLNLNVGEDDLFVQQISDGSNVGVVLSRNASCVEKCWGGWSWWIDLQKSAATTRRFYSPRAKCFVETELVSRAVFFISVAAAVIAMPWEYAAAAAILLPVRYTAVFLTRTRICRRLGERGLVMRHFMFDVAEPVIRAYIAVASRRKDDNAWR